MRVALFGGTFDPVHIGHLAVARAAADKFDLDVVYFVPADLPPHKRMRPLTEFDHRFAMLALATADDRRFVPSLLDADNTQPNYSINTVRRLRGLLKKSDRLFFLIGIDAFLEISTWKRPVELLSSCEFIVASRPGFSLADVGQALPETLRPSADVLRPMRKHQATGGSIVLPGATIHLLSGVDVKISSTQVRAAAQKSAKQLSRYVPPAVADYIKKERLYSRPAAASPHGRGAAKVLSFQRADRHQESRNQNE